MLSDPGNGYAHELGIAFAFGDELRRVYTRLGLLLPAFNGDESWELPLPTRIVVASDGTVRRIDADPDYTRRPDPGETLQVLSTL